MSDKPLKGVFCKTAQDRVSYEIDADSDLIFKLAPVLETRFGFQAAGLPLDGIDVIYWDFMRDGLTLILGWDVWSGCFIFAVSSEGDAIVQEIGQYLDTALHAL